MGPAGAAAPGVVDVDDEVVVVVSTFALEMAVAAPVGAAAPAGLAPAAGNRYSSPSSLLFLAVFLGAEPRGPVTYVSTGTCVQGGGQQLISMHQALGTSTVSDLGQ
jgi:hypothetical protein